MRAPWGRRPHVVPPSPPGPGMWPRGCLQQGLGVSWGAHRPEPQGGRASGSCDAQQQQGNARGGEPRGTQGNPRQSLDTAQGRDRGAHDTLQEGSGPQSMVDFLRTQKAHRDAPTRPKGSPLDLLLDLFHQQRLAAAESPGARRGPGAPFAGLHGPVELQRAAQ